ncbi:Urb2/Npa2 family-domain-containing protein [Xylariaceae sp. FL0662B]|nr:Urb2/Npa2 family-domain-containing protein [Xylariaceae sp. FL0662B]
MPIVEELLPMGADDSDAHSSRRLALIRFVRSLDENGTLAFPDKIQKLWLLLSATKRTRLHGIEESILRWIFKQMGGNSEDAELARRYPLSWTVISHIIPNIPAQTLGRSLAYLRFVSILRQTLEDVNRAQRRPIELTEKANGVDAKEESTRITLKRKRDDALPSNIDQLRTPEGCIKSVTEVFRALGSLLEQGEQFTATGAPEKRVGAEHIKSLFSSSSDESRDITARLLLICDRSLSVLEHGISQDQASWVEISTAIWNLRLHNKEDSLEFARHLYEPVCSIISRLKGVNETAPVMASNTVRDLWIRQLEQFLSTCFIRPTRQKFTIDENVEVLRTELKVSRKNLAGSTIVLWDIAARTPRDPGDPKLKTAHLLWVQAVFRTLLGGMKPLELATRHQILVRLLDIAIQTGSVPNTVTLRAVCREDALGSDETDWSLIAKIVSCDADVFLMDDNMVEDVFSRINSQLQADSKVRDEIVTRVIVPLETAFATARDLSGFIQRWYERLCKIPEVSLNQTIWFDPRIRQQLGSLLQSALTSTQLLRILDRLDSSNENRGALLVVLDGICEGITEEDFIQSVDSKVYSAVFDDKIYNDLPPDILALRWRIASRMASWETSDEIYRLWVATEFDLKKIVQKGSLSDPETFEAFSCCLHLWLANYPGGRYETDLAKLTCSFLEKLVSTIKTGDDPHALEPYINLVFRRMPKLAELPKQEANGLSDLIVSLSWHVGQRFAAAGDAQLFSPLQILLHNFDVEDEETLIDTLISQPLNALDSSNAQSGWTRPESLPILSILLDFPLAAFTKGRRKRIMSSWKKWRSSITTHALQDSQYATTVLRLLIRVMQQPTFYEGMEVDDLVHITSNMAKYGKGLLTLVEKLSELVLRHVVVNVEGPSRAYLVEASRFVNNFEAEGLEDTIARILLMRSLVSALNNLPSTKSYSSVVNLEEITQKLDELIQKSLSNFASESTVSPAFAEDDPRLLLLSVALSGAACITETHPGRSIRLPTETLRQLDAVSTTYVSKEIDIGWKLRIFLVRNFQDRYDVAYFSSQLEQATAKVDEDSIYDSVTAFFHTNNCGTVHRLLGELVSSGKLTSGPIGPLLAVRKFVELEGPITSPSQNEEQEVLDVTALHGQLTLLLTQVASLRHFKQLSDILLLLLEKHANSMTQFSIDTIMSTIVDVCSSRGPKIEEAKAAGEIYDRLCKLVALVLKRHRLRLRGHFPVLIVALQSLMSTLLADPHSFASDRPCRSDPPWLISRLKPRHAERFTRLLTLICEPSAASVARIRSNDLNSPTDVAKRAAGQDMFTIIELYIKLQLEVNVPRDIRKALEPGIYSILDITPQGCRRILNESLDANGRVVFRQMFADYKKFGKWTGV